MEQVEAFYLIFSYILIPIILSIEFKNLGKAIFIYHPQKNLLLTISYINSGFRQELR